MITVFVLFISCFMFFFINRQHIDLPSKRILLLYSFYWLISLFFSTLGLYGFNTPKLTTVFCMLCSCMMLTIGFLSVKVPVVSVNLKDSKLVNSVSSLMKNKFFIAVVIILLLYSFSLFYKYYQFISSGNLYEVRSLYYASQNENMYGLLFPQVNYYILKPVTLIFSSLFGFSILYNRSKITVVLFIFIFILSSLGGGRLDYFRYLIFPLLLFGLCFHYKKIKMTLSRSCYLVIACASVFLLLSVVGAGRRGHMEFDMESLNVGIEMTTEHLMSYSYGPIVAFDYALENNYVDKIGGYACGALTFNAFNEFLVKICNNIGVNYGSVFSDFVNLKQDVWIPLSGQHYDQSWNALFTWNLFFFMDFGILGILILPFLYGVLIRKAILLFMANQNIYSMILLYILFLYLILSVLDFNLVTFPIGFLLLFLWYKAKKYCLTFKW